MLYCYNNCTILKLSLRLTYRLSILHTLLQPQRHRLDAVPQKVRRNSDKSIGTSNLLFQFINVLTLSGKLCLWSNPTKRNHTEKDWDFKNAILMVFNAQSTNQNSC